MNSLIFNVGIILLTSIGVVQFCTKAFDLYASNTAILNIFGSQIERIDGISYVYSVFIVFFLGFFVIGFLWSTMFKNAELKKLQENAAAE
jgi:LMBR1 domain-containing protein 1